MQSINFVTMRCALYFGINGGVSMGRGDQFICSQIKVASFKSCSDTLHMSLIRVCLPLLVSEQTEYLLVFAQV